MSFHKIAGVIKVTVLALLVTSITSLVAPTTASATVNPANLPNCPTPSFSFYIDDSANHGNAYVGSTLNAHYLSANYYPSPNDLTQIEDAGQTGYGYVKGYEVDRYSANGSTLVEVLDREVGTSDTETAYLNLAQYKYQFQDVGYRIKFTIFTDAVCFNGHHTPTVASSAMSGIVQYHEVGLVPFLKGLESSVPLTPAFSPLVDTYTATAPLPASTTQVNLYPIVANPQSSLSVTGDIVIPTSDGYVIDSATENATATEGAGWDDSTGILTLPTNPTSSLMYYEETITVTASVSYCPNLVNGCGVGDFIHPTSIHHVIYSILPAPATVVAPATPSNLSIRRSFAGDVLSWRAYTNQTSGSSPISTYSIDIYSYDSSASGANSPTEFTIPASLTTTSGTTTSYSIPSLFRDKFYCFSVRAVNAEAGSSFTTVPARNYPDNISGAACASPIDVSGSMDSFAQSGLVITNPGISYSTATPTSDFATFNPLVHSYVATFASQGGTMIMAPSAPGNNSLSVSAQSNTPQVFDAMPGGAPYGRFPITSGIELYSEFVTDSGITASSSNSTPQVAYQFVTAVGHEFPTTPRGYGTISTQFFIQNPDLDSSTVSATVTGAGFSLNQGGSTCSAPLSAGYFAADNPCIIGVTFSPDANTPDTAIGNLRITFTTSTGSHSFDLPLLGHTNSTGVQTIEWPVDTNIHLGDQRLPILGESASTINYSVTDGSSSGCTISPDGNTFHAFSVGQCTITASIPYQSANSVLVQPTSASKTFVITKSKQFIATGEPYRVNTGTSSRIYHVGDAFSFNDMTTPVGTDKNPDGKIAYLRNLDSSNPSCSISTKYDSQGNIVSPYSTVTAISPGRCHFQVVIPGDYTTEEYDGPIQSVDIAYAASSFEQNVQTEYTVSTNAIPLLTNPVNDSSNASTIFNVQGRNIFSVQNTSEVLDSSTGVTANSATCAVNPDYPVLYDFANDEGITVNNSSAASCALTVSYPQVSSNEPSVITQQLNIDQANYPASQWNLLSETGFNPDGSAASTVATFKIDLAHTHGSTDYESVTASVQPKNGTFHGSVICNPIQPDQTAQCIVSGLVVGQFYGIFPVVSDVLGNIVYNSASITDWFTPHIISISDFDLATGAVTSDTSTGVTFQIPPMFAGNGSSIFLNQSPTISAVNNNDPSEIHTGTCSPLSAQQIANGQATCSVQLGLTAMDSYLLNLTIPDVLPNLTNGESSTASTWSDPNDLFSLATSIYDNDSLYNQAPDNYLNPNLSSRDFGASVHATFINQNSILISWVHPLENKGWKFDHYEVQITDSSSATVADFDTTKKALIYTLNPKIAAKGGFNVTVIAHPLKLVDGLKDNNDQLFVLSPRVPVSSSKNLDQQIAVFSADPSQSTSPYLVPQTIRLGDAVPLFASVTGDGISTSLLGSGVITYPIVSGSCFAQGSLLIAIKVDSCTVTAQISGDAGYGPATSTPFSVTILPGVRTLDWQPAIHYTLDQSGTILPAAIASVADVGDVVTYQVDSNGNSANCSVDQNTEILTFSSVGTCGIRAKISGSPDYLDAYSSPGMNSNGDMANGASYLEFTIGGATRTVNWSPRTTLTATDSGASVTLLGAPTVSSGTLGAISYQIVNAGSALCDIGDNNVIDFFAPGSCSIQAVVGGTGNYATATSSPVTFTVSSAPRAIVWRSPRIPASGASITLPAPMATGNGGFSYAVTDSTSTGCLIIGQPSTSVVSILAPNNGKCFIKVTALASPGYTSSSITDAFLIDGHPNTSLASLIIKDDTGTVLSLIPNNSTTPGFSNSYNTYTVPASSNPNTLSAKIVAVPLTSYTTMTLDGQTLAPGVSTTIPLPVGTSVHTLVALGSDSTTSSTFTFYLHRPNSIGSTLATVPVSRTISISNTAGSTLTIDSLSTNDTSTFAVSNAGSCVVNQTITAGSTCSVTINYLAPTITVPAQPAIGYVTMVGHDSQNNTITETVEVTGLASGNTQQITYNGPLNIFATSTSFETPTVTTHGGTLSYTVLGTSTAQCSVGRYAPTLTLGGTGLCAILVTAAANTQFAQASLELDFNVTNVVPTLNLHASSSSALISQSVTLSVINSPEPSQASFVYHINNQTSTGTCSIVNGVLTSITPGTCVISLSGTWTSGYANVTTPEQIIVFSKPQQILTWHFNRLDSVDTHVPFDSGSYTPSARAVTSGDGAITYSVLPGISSNTAGCIVDSASGVVTWTSAGYCYIVATAAETSAYSLGTTSEYFVVDSALPGTPTISSYSTDDGTAWITFTPPASNGGTPITGYTVSILDTQNNLTEYSCVPSGSCVSNSNGASYTLQITGLTTTAVYSAEVKATNGSGDGNYSAPVSGIEIIAHTGAVQGLTLTARDRGLDVSFTAPTCLLHTPSSCGTFENYEIDIETATVTVFGGAPVINWVPVGTYGAGQLSGGTFSVFGLTNGTRYNVRVIVTTYSLGLVNNQPAFVYESATATASQVPVGRPTAPLNINAVKNGPTSALITWATPASDGGTPIQSYDVTALDEQHRLLSATETVVTGTSATISGLDPAHSYTFQVFATSLAGVGIQSYSSTPLALNLAPRTLSINTPTTTSMRYGNSITVSATPNLGSGEGTISYTVRGGGCSISGSTVTGTGVTNGTTITCLVTAHITAGIDYDPADSADLSLMVVRSPRVISWYAVTPAPSIPLSSGPQALEAPVVSDNSAQLSYSVVSDSGHANTAGCSFDQSHNLLTTHTGTCYIQASAPADASYDSATSNNVLVTVSASATRSIIWSSNSSAYTWDYTQYDAALSLATSSTPTDPIQYYASQPGTAACSVEHGKDGVYRLLYTATGSCVITAFTPSTSTEAAVSSSHVFTISSAPQLLTWINTANNFTIGATVTLPLALSSGPGQISYKVRGDSASICHINNPGSDGTSTSPTFTMDAIGSCVVEANVAPVGTAPHYTYWPAVLPTDQSLTVTASTDSTLATMDLGAAASANLTVPFSPNVHTYSTWLRNDQDLQLHLTTTEVQAGISGLDVVAGLSTTHYNYSVGMTIHIPDQDSRFIIHVRAVSGATSDYTVNIHKYEAATITWPSLPTTPVPAEQYGGNLYQQAVTNGTAVISYSIDPSLKSICTGAKDPHMPLLSFTLPGTCSITVSSDGSDPHFAAVSRIFTVTIAPSDDATIGGIDFNAEGNLASSIFVEGSALGGGKVNTVVFSKFDTAQNDTRTTYTLTSISSVEPGAAIYVDSQPWDSTMALTFPLDHQLVVSIVPPNGDVSKEKYYNFVASTKSRIYWDYVSEDTSTPTFGLTDGPVSIAGFAVASPAVTDGAQLIYSLTSGNPDCVISGDGSAAHTTIDLRTLGASCSVTVTPDYSTFTPASDPADPYTLNFSIGASQATGFSAITGSGYAASSSGFDGTPFDIGTSSYTTTLVGSDGFALNFTPTSPHETIAVKVDGSPYDCGNTPDTCDFSSIVSQGGVHTIVLSSQSQFDAMNNTGNFDAYTFVVTSTQTPTLSWAPLIDPTSNGELTHITESPHPVAIQPPAGSTGAVTYTVVGGNNSVCAIADPTLPSVVFDSAGQCTLQAAAAAAPGFNASSTQKTITVDADLSLDITGVLNYGTHSLNISPSTYPSDYKYSITLDNASDVVAAASDFASVGYSHVAPLYILNDVELSTPVTSSLAMSAGSVNVFTVKYTNDVGDTRFYEFDITVPAAFVPSTDAAATITLNNQSVTNGSTVNVASGTTSIAVVVTPQENHASYVIHGDTGLTTGSNAVTVTVTAQDGTTSVATHFTVIVAAYQNSGGGGSGFFPPPPAITPEPTPTPTPSPSPTPTPTPTPTPAPSPTPTPAPTVKTDQPTVNGSLSANKIWASSTAKLTLSGVPDTSVLQISSSTPTRCSVDSSGLVIGLSAGQCLISVIYPADSTHNASISTFTLTIVAPTVKLLSIKVDTTHVIATVVAGVRYARRTVTLWQKVKGTKKETLVATVKLGANGAKSVKVVKKKHITYYAKYKAKVIATLTVK